MSNDVAFLDERLVRIEAYCRTYAHAMPDMQRDAADRLGALLSVAR